MKKKNKCICLGVLLTVLTTAVCGKIWESNSVPSAHEYTVCGENSGISANPHDDRSTEVWTAQVTGEYHEICTDSSPVENVENYTSADTVPQTATIIDGVPHYSQNGSFPTGCESVAAVSLMQFYGFDITISGFIDNFLPMSPPPTLCDGQLCADSPWYSFIGDPRSTDGYGCYSTVIVNAVNESAEGALHAEYIYSGTLEYLAETCIDSGEPVIIWATIGMKPAYNGNSWLTDNDEWFTFVCPEHALILLGYDDESYYFSDSMSESDITAYPKSACEAAFDALGCQAVRICR